MLETCITIRFGKRDSGSEARAAEVRAQSVQRPWWMPTRRTDWKFSRGTFSKSLEAFVDVYRAS